MAPHPLSRSLGDERKRMNPSVGHFDGATRSTRLPQKERNGRMYRVICAAIAAAVMATIEAASAEPTKIKTGQTAPTPYPDASDRVVRITNSALLSTSAWTACGGSASIEGSAAMPIGALLPVLGCVGKNDKTLALQGVDAVEKAVQSDYAFRPDLGQVWLTRMKIHAENGNIRAAQGLGTVANALQKQWDGSTLAEEQTIYWDMLPAAMRTVLSLHGGIRTDNQTARPTEWKADGARDLWIYRTGAATVTTYVFAGGKLVQTLKT